MVKIGGVTAAHKRQLHVQDFPCKLHVVGVHILVDFALVECIALVIVQNPNPSQKEKEQKR